MYTDPQESVWDREWKNYNQRRFFKPNLRVLEEVKICFNNKIRGKKIVELGAGSGSDIMSLAKSGAEAYALDFSSESLKSINFWAKKKNTHIQTVRADIKKIPFPDNYFDLVYSVGLVEHFKKTLPLIKEQLRILKPGGFLIVDVPQKYTLYTIAKHVRMKLNTHPFGWETEFSKSDFKKIASKFNQDVHHIYGRDLDIISKLPPSVRPLITKIFSKTLERTFIAPYICLCIGLVIKVRK